MQYAVSSIRDALAQWIKLPVEYAQASENGLPPKDKKGPIDVKIPVLKSKIF